METSDLHSHLVVISNQQTIRCPFMKLGSSLRVLKYFKPNGCLISNFFK